MEQANKRLLLGRVFNTTYSTNHYDEENGYVPADAELDMALSTLSHRERAILEERFGLKDGRRKTLKETGLLFNICSERTRQIEAKALRKLRHPSRARILYPVDKR